MTTVPIRRRTPNDADFDYEIEGVAAIYHSEDSLSITQACQFGIASREIITEEFLLDLRSQLSLSFKTELTADLTILIGILRRVNNAETNNANQTKLPL